MRTKGSGSIIRRGDRYYAIVNTRDPRNNKRTRRWSKGCTTKLAAQIELNKILSEGDEYAPARGLTLGRLVDDYIASCEQRGRAETTIEGYRVLRRRFDAIANAQVERINAGALDAFYTRLREREKRPLSPTTVAHVHNLIRAAFTWAVRKGRVNRNPMARVDAPKRKRSSAGALQIDEAAALLRAIKGHRLEAPMQFALGTGMRRGEVVGLRLPSVDADRNLVIVRESRANVKKEQFQKPTKTEQVREVPLGDLALSALKLARKQRAERKLKAGGLWEASDHVFTDEIGRPLHPNALTDAFRRVFAKLEDQGLPHRRLHDLRHTAGTLMLASGIDLNTVQQILGHSVASTTLNTYGHVLKGHKEEAVRSIDTALNRGKTSRKVSERRA
jgi:integrase